MISVNTVLAVFLAASYIFAPDAAHTAGERAHTGIPSIAVSKGGRLWATWYGGNTGGEDSNNYCTLAASADGGRTWKDVLVADPDGDGPLRAFDPEVWVSPDNRLFWTWTERKSELWSKAKHPNAGCLSDPKLDRLMCAEFPADGEIGGEIPKPRQIARGVMMCKPAVLDDGTWLFPVAHWGEAPSACFYASADKGKTFSFRGGITVPERNRSFDEHTVVQLGNGELLSFLRSQNGTNVFESVSRDRGFTWSEAKPAGFKHASARHFLKKLSDGRLLLVKHGAIGEDCGRSKLTAYISDDGGKNWKGGLMIDKRFGVSYPDGDQGPDGTIYVVYDRDRLGAQEILMKKFTADDVLAAKSADPAFRKPVTVTGLAGILPPTVQSWQVYRNPALKGKKVAYYCDDVIWLYRDLARQRPGSLFDNPFMKMLKEAHDKYGFKVQLNSFYRTDFFYGTDEFTLAEMPDAWKDEWQANRDWLKIGFHSLQEFPDYPFINAGYDDMRKVVEMIRREVSRFAGEGVFTYGAVCHWGSCSKDACRALKDLGFKVVLATCGPRRAYNGDPSSLPYGHAMRLLQNRKRETALYSRLSEDTAISSSIGGYNNLTYAQAKRTFGVFDCVRDGATGLCFKEVEDFQPLAAGINLYNVESMTAAFKKVLGNEFVIYGNHEQYFYRDYLAYQRDYAEKFLTAAKLLNESGYEYFFFEELGE